MSQRTANTAVARGARFLDKVTPGWFAIVKVEKLSLSSCSSCICGQIGEDAGYRALLNVEKLNYRRSMGYYSKVCVALRTVAESRGIPTATARKHGFASYFGFDVSGNNNYVELDAAWTQEIESRRTAIS